MFRLVHIAHRHLVTSPIVFALLSVYLWRTGPTLGRAHYDHWPCRTPAESFFSRLTPDPLYFTDYCIKGFGHRVVHLRRLVAFDEKWFVAVSFEKLSQLIIRDSREKTRVCYLVAVKVKDRQDATIALRIQKFVPVPSCRQRTGLGFAVSNNASHYQIGIVEGCSVGMR